MFGIDPSVTAFSALTLFVGFSVRQKEGHPAVILTRKQRNTEKSKAA